MNETMSETITKKTWGEREGVTLELLSKFTKPGHKDFGEVMQYWNFRGDLTSSGDRRMRALLGEEAYEHLHWDAVACNGGVLVVVPRWKFSERDSRPGGSLSAPYWWAMSSIADVDPDPHCCIRRATEDEIAMVANGTQALLSELPGLEFMHIGSVSYYSTDKPGKKQWRKAPGDVRYFRFAAGYGLVAIADGVGKEGRE